MKKFFLFLSVIFVCFQSYSKTDFTLADKLYLKGENYSLCESELQNQLKNCETPSEKSEVYWRLARITLLMGEDKTSKEEKRTFYSKGVEYSNKAIEADPKNPYAYMWHSANVGRESQTKGLSEQVKIVSVVTNDLSMIVDKLHELEISEAWQALSEMYYQHPFKSNDDAIGFCRKALSCIPSNESRLSSYCFFAEILYDRNRSASKRKSRIEECETAFAKSYDSNIDKYCYFEGKLGCSYKPVWAQKSLVEMSDREEAVAIINYAISLYQKIQEKTPTDKKDYELLVSHKEQWK